MHPAADDPVLARLDRIERSLDRLTGLLDQVPGGVAIVTDLADGLARQGLDFDARGRAALRLADAVSDPEVAEALVVLARRAPDLLSLMEGARGLVATAGDATDAAIADLSRRGVDVDVRVRTAVRLAERVTEPRTAAIVDRLLDRLLDRADDLEGLFAQLDALPGMLATAGDVLDTAAANLQARGVQLDVLPGRVSEIMVKVGLLLQSEAFREFLAIGPLSPQTAGAASEFGQAVLEARREPLARAGFGALWRALRDPDVQAAVGFGLSFARRFGRLLSAPPRG